MIGRCSRLRRRFEHGAVAIEGGLVMAFFIAPMLLGILGLGHYFWQHQKVTGVNLNVNSSTLVGELTCGELKTRIFDLVDDALENANVALGSPFTADDIDLKIVRGVAGSIGIDAQVGVTLPVANYIGSFLPDNGAFFDEILLKLDNVQLSGSADSC